MGHTPGPWDWMQDDGANGRTILRGWCGAKGSFHEGLSHNLQECGDTILICADLDNLADTLHHSPNEANARLIAAAPDLLAACKLTHSTMRRQFVGGNAPDSWGDDEHAAFTQLNAAIAKAEGKQ